MNSVEHFKMLTLEEERKYYDTKWNENGNDDCKSLKRVNDVCFVIKRIQLNLFSSMRVIAIFYATRKHEMKRFPRCRDSDKAKKRKL